MKVTCPQSITETKLFTNLPIVGSLYENPTPCHFHVSSDPNIVGLFCPNRGYELDYGKYRECLYRVSQVQSYLIASLQYAGCSSNIGIKPHISRVLMDEPFSHRVLFGVSLFPYMVLPGLVNSLHIYSNLYWPSYRCNRSATYLWTRFNLYANLIFLVTRSPAPNSILPPHAILPQIQGPIPQCTSVCDPRKIR